MSMARSRCDVAYKKTAAEIKTRVSDLKIFALITAGSH
jgi:hypothetical protein